MNNRVEPIVKCKNLICNRCGKIAKENKNKGDHCGTFFDEVKQGMFCSGTIIKAPKIKTYHCDWGNGTLILDEKHFIEYLCKSEMIFTDKDIRNEPQELTIEVQYSYTQEELDNLPEFDY